MNKKAFTLIELLVVITVLGILMVIMLPVMGRAREAGKRATCVNKMRQIGMAMHMFANDHNGVLPAQSTGLPACFYSSVVDYLDLEGPSGGSAFFNEFFTCPSSTSNKSWSINVNFLLGQRHFSKPLSKIDNPTETIMCYDYWTGGRIWSNWSTGYPPDEGEIWVADWHSGGANVLWVDGHVSWHRKPEIVNTEKWWYP
jgi:prepilin-type N-terminal cleavage/methylation domain-containing protein/prepilin-type processing-associated H-X9-DG protein